MNETDIDDEELQNQELKQTIKIHTLKRRYRKQP